MPAEVQSDLVLRDVGCIWFHRPHGRKYERVGVEGTCEFEDFSQKYCDVVPFKVKSYGKW